MISNYTQITCLSLHDQVTDGVFAKSDAGLGPVPNVALLLFDPFVPGMSTKKIIMYSFVYSKMKCLHHLRPPWNCEL